MSFTPERKKMTSCLCFRVCPQISDAVDRTVAPPRGLISMFAVVKLALWTYGAIKFSLESP